MPKHCGTFDLWKSYILCKVITIFFQFSNKTTDLTILILLGQPLSGYYYIVLYFHSNVLLNLHCTICTHKSATFFSNEIPIFWKALEPAIHQTSPSLTVPYQRQEKQRWKTICEKLSNSSSSHHQGSVISILSYPSCQHTVVLILIRLLLYIESARMWPCWKGPPLIPYSFTIKLYESDLYVYISAEKKTITNYSLDINYTYRVVLDLWSSKCRGLVTSQAPEVISVDPLPIASHNTELWRKIMWGTAFRTFVSMSTYFHKCSLLFLAPTNHWIATTIQ